jgi:hypothetical protein
MSVHPLLLLAIVGVVSALPGCARDRDRMGRGGDTGYSSDRGYESERDRREDTRERERDRRERQAPAQPQP